MWCIISEPGGTVHELTLPRDVKGIDVLEKICSRLRMIEKDYFGLRFTNPSNNVQFWLNLRNLLAPQLSGKAPYRLNFCVKYFVKPQELQQSVTRNMFYLSCREDLIKSKYNLSKLDDQALAKLYSYVAQIENGEYNPEALTDYSKLFPCRKWSSEFEHSIESAHLDLEGMTADEARVQVLHTLSNLLEYGVETFNVNSATARNTKLILVCRFDGLRIFKEETTPPARVGGKKKSKYEDKVKENNDPENEVVFLDKCEEVSEKKDSHFLQFISYDEISTVSYKGKLFTISYGDATLHNQKKMGFRLKVQQATIDLFRTFTEFHSFYQCGMVKKSVMEKCTRNSVGRVASFFRPNTKIGRTFLFDVMKTRRQVYNATWKDLHAPGKRRQSLFYSSERGLGRRSIKSRMSSSSKAFQNDEDVEKKKALEDGSKVDDMPLGDLKEFVRTLRDSRTCQVCMDADVSTAFCPCGHVICCVQCSAVVKECPLCRAHITYAQRVFFSWEPQTL
eukprot:gene12949-14281_t